MHAPASSADQPMRRSPGASYPERGTEDGRRLDDLLAATVALLMRTVSTLGLPEGDQEVGAADASPARTAGRIAADAARLTAAVAQLVRAHHLRSAPTPQAAGTRANAALVALLTELDAEEEEERSRL